MHDDVTTKLNYNPSELASLTRLAVKTNTIEDFCKISGLSRSVISKAINCSLKARPRRKTLYQIATASNGRVTINQLLVSCGYEKENTNPVNFSTEKTAPVPTVYPNATIIISDDITEILTQIKEISQIDTTFPIVVLVKKLDTLIFLKQFNQSSNDIKYALLME